MDAELSRRISVMAEKYRRLQLARYDYLATIREPGSSALMKQDKRDRVDMAVGAMEFMVEQVMVRQGELEEKSRAPLSFSEVEQ